MPSILRTIAYAAAIAATHAIKLQAEVETQKFRGLTDYSAWETTTSKYETLKAAGGKFTDPDFPPNDESRGTIKGDSARGAAGHTAGPAELLAELFE